MKKLLIFLFIIPVFAQAQYDSTKSRQPVNGYGFDWNNGKFKFSAVMPGDTIKLAMKDSGAIAVKNKKLYLWTGYVWQQASSGGGPGGGRVDSCTSSNDSLYYWVGGAKTLFYVGGSTDTTYLRRDIDINTAQALANYNAIQQRTDSLRNNAGVLEIRKNGGVFVPQFTLPRGGITSIVPGTNITVDTTDPANPIVSSTGGGKVDSVVVTPDSLYLVTVYAGGFRDSISFDGKATVTFYGKNTTKDSTILLMSDGTRYAAKDSIGVGGGGSAGWSLTGNTGTDTLVNFIGTTDAKNLLFKVNNVFSGKIDRLYGRTFFGYGAGNHPNMTGVSNTGFGYNSLANTTTGINNTAIGYNSLGSNTTGSNNISVGIGALETSTTGSNLLAVGRSALRLNTTGIENSAIGYLAMQSNTTGGYNTAIGNNAMNGATTSSFNVAVGYNALNGLLTTNGQNTAVGYQSLQSATTQRNSAVGYGALQFTSTGQLNTAIGMNAGNGNTTGSNNLFLGYYSGLGSTTVSNQIFIDNTNRGGVYATDQAGAPIYAITNATVASQVVRLNGRVGINTHTPSVSAALQVESTTQGFLPPRMTATQAEAITSKAEGLMVYSTDGSGATITSKGWWGYDGSTWQKLN